MFHIYVIATIDEGISLLVNKPAGVKQAFGLYPKDTVNGMVMRHIAEFARRAKMFNAKKHRESRAIKIVHKYFVLYVLPCSLGGHMEDVGL